jgi:hypothetical protein
VACQGESPTLSTLSPQSTPFGTWAAWAWAPDLQVARHRRNPHGVVTVRNSQGPVHSKWTVVVGGGRGVQCCPCPQLTPCVQDELLDGCKPRLVRVLGLRVLVHLNSVLRSGQPRCYPHRLRVPPASRDWGGGGVRGGPIVLGKRLLTITSGQHGAPQRPTGHSQLGQVGASHHTAHVLGPRVGCRVSSGIGANSLCYV